MKYSTSTRINISPLTSQTWWKYFGETSRFRY